MPTYKCRTCGNEYKHNSTKCACCGGNSFFIDFYSYEQLGKTKSQLEKQNSQLKIRNSQLETQNSQLETRTNKKESDLSYNNKYITSLKTSIKVLSSFLTILVLGTIGGGYWGYLKFQEITKNNQSLSSNLESTRQNLNSQINQINSDKSSLQSQIKQLNSDKSSLENRINTLETNYSNILKNNYNINTLRQGWNITWNGSLSSNNTSDRLVPFIIAEDSYIDIILSDLSEGGDADFELFDYNGNAVPDSKQTTGGGDELKNFYLNAGSYYVKVWVYGDKYTSYTLKVYRR